MAPSTTVLKVSTNPAKSRIVAAAAAAANRAPPKKRVKVDGASIPMSISGAKQLLLAPQTTRIRECFGAAAGI